MSELTAKSLLSVETEKLELEIAAKESENIELNEMILRARKSKNNKEIREKQAILEHLKGMQTK